MSTNWLFGFGAQGPVTSGKKCVNLPPLCHHKKSKTFQLKESKLEEDFPHH